MARHSLDATAQQLVSQLIDALRALPGAHAELSAQIIQAPTAPGDRHDARIEVQWPGRQLTVLVEARRHVYPRDVQQLLWRLKSVARGDVAHGMVPLLAAGTLSPGAKTLLHSEGIGYFDSGGSLFLQAPGAFVLIDRPPPKAEVSGMRSLFSGRRAQAIHALLLHRDQWWGVHALAALAQVSPATVSQVMSELQQLDWVESRGQGPAKERRLHDASGLLDAWTAQVTAGKPPTLRRYFVPGLKGDALLDGAAQALTAEGAAYAVTHEAAAQRYAPFLSNVAQVRCRLVWSPAADAALAALGARAVTEGANLGIIESKSGGELLFRQCIGPAWLASPLQVYLDLLQGEGRAKEMAAHLRQQVIGC